MSSDYPCPVITVRQDGLSTDAAELVSKTAASGGVIVFPTETFYALGADPRRQAALEKVFRLKGRALSEPLLLLIDREERVADFAADLPAPFPDLMAHFWPGPLTLLFPAREGLPPAIVSPSGQVAMRVPGSATSRAVIRAAGGVLTGTSANRSGSDPPSDPRQAAAGLGPGPGPDLLVDAGTLPPSNVSTVLRLADGEPVALREGAVGLDEVREFLSCKGWF